MDKYKGFKLACLFAMTLRLTVIGDNCPVNPECSCYGSRLSCSQDNGRYLPRFLASQFNFSSFQIRGTMDMNVIRSGTFPGLSTHELSIRFTAITDIGCNDLDGITFSELDLSHNRLRSVPSCSLKKVKNLQELDLADNNLKEIKPGAFNDLPHLTMLRLDGNHISALFSTAFDGLLSLSSLRLQENCINRLHPKLFDALRNLEFLTLGQNNISEIDRTTFRSLRMLTSLHVDKNRLLEIADDLLVNMVRLKYLYLQGNLLSTLPKNVFQGNTLLEVLDLSNNRLTGFIPGAFLKTPKLKHLSLAGNFLTTPGLATLDALPSHSFFDLSSNNLTSIEPKALSKCPQVETIHLQDNFINKVHPGAFNKLGNLSYLDLSNNNLNETLYGFELITGNLKTLKLGRNRIKFIAPLIPNRNTTTLRWLDLSGNGLTSESWPWLEKIVRGMDRLESLDLRENDFTNVSSELYEKGPLGVHQRDIMLSGNKLSVLNVSVISDVVFLNVTNNLIGSLTIDIYDPEDIINLDIQISHNRLSRPIKLNLQVSNDYFDAFVYVLDLSYNEFFLMDRFPLQVFPVSDENCPRYIVHDINLSNNFITSLLPEACLGIVEHLDLSNNQIEILGALVPQSDRSTFQLETLLLSRNRIHRVASDAFPLTLSSEMFIYLNNNNITDVSSLRILAEERQVSSLNLAGNPIHCGCTIEWLRNETITSKLGNIRCHTPQSAEGFLAVCSDLSDECSQQNKPSDDMTALCKSDRNVRLANFTARLMLSDGQSNVNVTWSANGPGLIAYFKLRTINVYEQADSFIMVPPHKRTVVLHHFTNGRNYNICITVVYHTEVLYPEESADKEICVPIFVTGDSSDLETTFVPTKEAFICLVVISVACVIALLVILLVFLFRRCISEPHQSPDNNAPSNPASQSVSSTMGLQTYSHPENNVNQTDEKNDYEAIDYI